MAEAKILILLANWLGYPLYGFIILNYWGEFQSLIMMILGAIFATVKIIQAVAHCYFYIKRNFQDLRMRDLRIEERERENDSHKEPNDE